MQTLLDSITKLNNPRIIFILCGVFIFSDIITGYLKALKYKNINSSISRDGYIKKIGWMISLLLGFVIDFLLKINIFLIGSSLVCITTEAISVYENLSEIGVKLPFAKYFEKVKEEVDIDE